MGAADLDDQSSTDEAGFAAQSLAEALERPVQKLSAFEHVNEYLLEVLNKDDSRIFMYIESTTSIITIVQVAYSNLYSNLGVSMSCLRKSKIGILESWKLTEALRIDYKL